MMWHLVVTSIVLGCWGMVDPVAKFWNIQDFEKRQIGFLTQYLLLIDKTLGKGAPRHGLSIGKSWAISMFLVVEKNSLL